VPLDRLAAAGDPQLRRLLLFARARHEPFGAGEAAALLGVHHTVARSRLDQLVEAGFLSVTLERRGSRRGPGAGRPAKIYSVAPDLEGVEFPDRRYGELIGLLLQKIPASGVEQAMRETGEAFGHRLAAAAKLQAARNVRTGLQRVCDALGALGFQASLRSLEGDEVVLTTPTCPLRSLVVQQPAACEIDRGMWAGLVERGLRGVEVKRAECRTARCLSENASCEIVVSLRAHDSSRSGGSVKR